MSLLAFFRSKKQHAAERRRAIRHEPDTPPTAVLEGDRPVSRVANVSAGGIGLVLVDAPEPDTELDVELYGVSGLSSCARRLRVVHVIPQRDGTYLVGCRFTRSLGCDELRALSAPLIAGSRPG